MGTKLQWNWGSNDQVFPVFYRPEKNSLENFPDFSNIKQPKVDILNIRFSVFKLELPWFGAWLHRTVWHSFSLCYKDVLQLARYDSTFRQKWLTAELGHLIWPFCCESYEFRDHHNLGVFMLYMNRWQPYGRRRTTINIFQLEGIFDQIQ